MSADVKGTPSENVTSGAQGQRIGEPVGRRRPFFRQPRLEVVGGAIDANERGHASAG